SLSRAAVENVGSRTITGGTFSSASANYSAPSLTGTPTLTISQAALTATIANQTKVYGANDQALTSVTPTFTGLLNRPAVCTCGGHGALADPTRRSSDLSLSRAAVENVGSRTITGGTFSSASANYSAPSLTGTPTLTISQAALTATIANQTKV